MPETVSIDEFLSSRQSFVKSSPRGDVIMKAYAEPATWNPNRRSARFVMSAEVEDRDRDIIMQDGLDTLAFLKNPVALYAHNSWGLPIGHWEDIQKVAGRPKRTEGECVFDPEGTDEECDAVAAKVQCGTLRMCSIGFIPRVINRRAEEVGSGRYPGYEILEAELVECSVVPVGANPMALVKSTEGQSRDAVLDMIERVLDTWVKHPETGLIVPRERYEQAYRQATGQKSSVIVQEPPVDMAAEEQPTKVEEREQAPSIEVKASDEIGFFTRLAKFLGLNKEEQAPDPPDALKKAASLERAKAVETRIAAINA